MNSPVFVNIKMVPAGVELVLNALNQLPRAQSNDLWQDIFNQYQAEFKRLQAEAAPEQA